MGTRISAIICTHNRAPYLSKALSSLEQQNLPKEEYEIIVVDNRSTDNTRDVVGSFAPGGNIRYIHEPVIGLSHARNTGWQNAASPYVAYLDDDAVASRVWLRRILRVFESGEGNLGCVGGKVNPIWEAPRPAWLGDGLVSGLTVVDWSDNPHVLTNLNSEWLAGANMALQRRLLERLKGFTPHLDRAGTRLLSSGDVFLEKQVQKEGYVCFYDPEITVSHHIPASRLTRSWFVRRYFYQGVSDAVMGLLAQPSSKRKRVEIAAKMAIGLLRPPFPVLDLARPTKDPERFTRKCFSLITLGHVVGLLVLHRYPYEDH